MKAALRKKYKEKRAKLSIKEMEDKSIAIANNLLPLPIWEHSFYHLFLSIERLREIDTEFILHILNGKDKNVIVSKSDFASAAMTHYLLTDSTPLKTNEWGIPEPLDGIEIPTKKIEVVFIPLLAFDKNGHRIGYGKGFYDRFLRNCKPETLKIGLSFFEAEENLIESHEHDIPMDYCVTPEKVYRF